MNRWALVGYVFVAVMSVIAVFCVEGCIIKFLLVLSAVVSLFLAVYSLWSCKRMEEKIKKLEEEKQDKLVFASEETCRSIIDELV